MARSEISTAIIRVVECPLFAGQDGPAASCAVHGAHRYTWRPVLAQALVLGVVATLPRLAAFLVGLAIMLEAVAGVIDEGGAA